MRNIRAMNKKFAKFADRVKKLEKKLRPRNEILLNTLWLSRRNDKHGKMPP